MRIKFALFISVTYACSTTSNHDLPTVTIIDTEQVSDGQSSDYLICDPSDCNQKTKEIGHERKPRHALNRADRKKSEVGEGPEFKVIYLNFKKGSDVAENGEAKKVINAIVPLKNRYSLTLVAYTDFSKKDAKHERLSLQRLRKTSESLSLNGFSPKDVFLRIDDGKKSERLKTTIKFEISKKEKK